MCTGLLPLGVNPIAVNKYINIHFYIQTKLHYYFFPHWALTAAQKQQKLGNPWNGYPQENLNLNVEKNAKKYSGRGFELYIM